MVYFDSFITEQTHYINGDVYLLCRYKSVFLEITDTRKRQLLQLDRGFRKMRKETEVQIGKFKLGVQHVICLFFHYLQYLAFKSKRENEHDNQDCTYDYPGNF